MKADLADNSTRDLLVARFLEVRRASDSICAPLEIDDYQIQSITETSPPKWHLAHVTWFFETFLLARQSDYQPFDPSYKYLFNSYYNTVGKQFPRPHRGLLSRPGHGEVLAYRQYVDEHVDELLRNVENASDDVSRILTIGLNHEQQHQELILTDIKHVLAQDLPEGCHDDNLWLPGG